MLHHDTLVFDARLAARVLVLGIALMLLTAALGLSHWPGVEFYALAHAPTGEFINGSQGLTTLVCALFWGSAPSKPLQRVVLGGSLVTTAVVAYLLRQDVFAGEALDVAADRWMVVLIAAFGIASALGLAWRLTRRGASALDSRLRILVVLVLLFSIVPRPALDLTAALHPTTFDLYVLRWDAAAGLGIVPGLVAFVDAVPGLREMVKVAYGLTPLMILSVALLQLRGKPERVPSALLTWVLLAVSALLAYHAFPISGPQYVFGTHGFVKELARPGNWPVSLALVAPAPRNGMPSMHFGWALAATMLWWQTNPKPVGRAVMAFITGLVALATLVIGEHYVIDLIVAVPFTLAMVSTAANRVSWTQRAPVFGVGICTWIVWILCLRFATPDFVAHPALCWLLIGATACVVAWQARRIAGFHAWGGNGQLAQPSEASTAARGLHRRFGAMYFASGAAALVYQVLFAKELALVFGSTSTATFTVLATFLGGMALGSVFGGAAARRPRPLVTYALVEAAIAIYCIATPWLFSSVQHLYVSLASGMAPDASSVQVLRVLLGGFVLLVPTVAMGATLPLLTRALDDGDREGRRIARLYFWNTAGAALGSLLAAYVVIPNIGAQGTARVAAVLNLLVALGAMELAKQFGDGAAAGVAASASPTERAWTSFGAHARRAAMLTLGLGGALSLGLEVVYVHMLSVVAGNSVYAFGLMVATFLCGLSVGGEGARRWMQRADRDLPAGLALVFVLLGATVAIGSLGWNAIPDYFAGFAQYPLVRSFSAREAVRGFVCALVMLPPTVLIGAAYALGMDILTRDADTGRLPNVALGGAINTLGNIAGVLLFGFVLLPRLGGLGSSHLIAAGCVLLGLAVFLLCGRRAPRPFIALALCSVAAMAGVTKVPLDLQAISSGSNVYFSPQAWGDVIDHAESIDGGFTAVTQRTFGGGDLHTLVTNGKFQGNDAIDGEMKAQVGFAFAPLLHQPRRDRALVIGYGTGVTSRVFHEAGFRDLDIAELSADVVQLADRHFAKVNGRVSAQPGVHLNVTDGRNFLLLSHERYDVVSIEITSIWFAGAASLYNQEFYRSVKAHLAPGGVLQQWVQLHHLAPTDILQVVTTLRSEFRFVSLYVMGGQGILVATDDPVSANPSAAAISALDTAPGLVQLRAIAGRSGADLAGDRWLNPQSTDRYVKEFGKLPAAWISTDDNLLLEYSTPRANANDSERSQRLNFEVLGKYKAAS